MKKIALSLIIVLAMLAAGCTGTGQEPAMEKSTDGNTMPNEKTTQDNMDGYTGEMIAGATTPYLRYNEADFNKASGDGKTIYLYFYANWCPICNADRPKILAAFNELDNANAIGFEVHFNDDKTTDEDRAAARTFGVSYQHTTIILNKNGDVRERLLTPISKDEIKTKLAEGN